MARLTAAQKAKLVQIIEEKVKQGDTLKEACKIAKISDKTYYNWRKAKAKKPKPFVKEIELEPRSNLDPLSTLKNEMLLSLLNLAIDIVEGNMS